MKFENLMKFNYLLTLCFFVSLTACDNNSSTSESPQTEQSSPAKTPCKFGQPKAIFSDAITQVSTHKFSVEGQKSLESMNLVNGVRLDLYQDGCDHLRQEFQFSFAPNNSLSSDSTWILEAAKQLDYLATFSERHAAFGIWARAIRQLQPQMQIGRPLEPEEGTLITVDRLRGKQEHTLIIRMEGLSS